MAQGDESGKNGWWQKPVAVIAGLTALVGALAGLLQAFDSPAFTRIADFFLGEEPIVATAPPEPSAEPAIAPAVPALPASVEDPHWISDRRTGCKVYNPEPIANEAIDWSGPCVEGLAHGSGVLTWYLNGEATGLRYQGEYKNGLRDGFGTETMYEGSEEESYTGEFKANDRNGTGIIRWVGGDSWEGPFVGGLPNGWGTHTSADGRTTQRRYANGNLTAEQQ
jgi:hypothetical protein